MPKRTCTVPNCEKPHRAHGYCNAHAARWYRTGDPGPAEIKHYAMLVGHPCSVDGCDKVITLKDARGLCARHYKRWTVHGDPTVSLTLRLDELSYDERFWAHVDTSGECWMWLGRLNLDGYGVLRPHPEAGYHAHRIAYVLAGREIPDGTELDHLCHTRDVTCIDSARCQHRRCVNPDHLEPVTHHENVLRGNATLRKTDTTRKRAGDEALRLHAALHPAADKP